MSWTAQNQVDTEEKTAALDAEFNEKWIAWHNAVQSGVPGTSQAAVEDVVQRRQQNLNNIQSQYDSIADSGSGVIDELIQLAMQISAEKTELAKLRSEAGTRDYQAHSVNPKVRGSPYTNILGLQRTFRGSTRSGLLAASIVFGTLALGSLGYLTYRVVV